MNCKRRALRRSKTLGQGTEAQADTQSSRLAVLVRKLKSPFTCQFWEDRFEPTDDETLVDGKGLSYAYLSRDNRADRIKGFSPNDLRVAQKNGGYATHQSPDFIN